MRSSRMLARLALGQRHARDRESLAVERQRGLDLYRERRHATPPPRREALDDAQLPTDEEFRRVMREYMHWATRQVNAYSPTGARVERDQPMPRWSWDGLQK